MDAVRDHRGVSLADAADGGADGGSAAFDAGVCDAPADAAARAAAATSGGSEDAPTADNGNAADTVADPTDKVVASDGNPAGNAGVAAVDFGP